MTNNEPGVSSVSVMEWYKINKSFGSYPSLDELKIGIDASLLIEI
jgi:hypothetical protein